MNKIDTKKIHANNSDKIVTTDDTNDIIAINRTILIMLVLLVVIQSIWYHVNYFHPHTLFGISSTPQHERTFCS